MDTDLNSLRSWLILRTRAAAVLYTRATIFRGKTWQLQSNCLYRSVADWRGYNAFVWVILIDGITRLLTPIERQTRCHDHVLLELQAKELKVYGNCTNKWIMTQTFTGYLDLGCIHDHLRVTAWQCTRKAIALHTWLTVAWKGYHLRRDDSWWLPTP